MDPPVRMGVVVTSILHESIHGLLYFYLSHFILQSVSSKITPKNRVFLPIIVMGIFYRCFISACFIL